MFIITAVSIKPLIENLSEQVKLEVPYNARILNVSHGNVYIIHKQTTIKDNIYLKAVKQDTPFVYLDEKYIGTTEGYHIFFSYMF